MPYLLSGLFIGDAIGLRELQTKEVQRYDASSWKNRFIHNSESTWGRYNKELSRHFDSLSSAELAGAIAYRSLADYPTEGNVTTRDLSLYSFTPPDTLQFANNDEVAPGGIDLF